LQTWSLAALAHLIQAYVVLDFSLGSSIAGPWQAPVEFGSLELVLKGRTSPGLQLRSVCGEINIT